MAEYTYEDVIINPKDPRVEIGAEYWFCDCPNDTVKRLNNAKAAKNGHLSSVESNNERPFYDEDSRCWLCIIRKKEPEKKYVPFDLSVKEQIFEICGCWLVDKDHGDYYCATAIYPSDNLIHVDDYGEISPEQLLEKFEFLHNGSPCGIVVEDE